MFEDKDLLYKLFDPKTETMKRLETITLKI